MPNSSDPATALGARLGHDFSHGDLAAAALRHRSAAGVSNERLEFLGDAVLGLAIAEALYERCPELTEGDLTRIRASLVNRDALAGLARRLELGELLAMGVGEQRSGGFQRGSILADALEAALGAVFLDAGYTAARAVVRHLFAEPLSQPPDPTSLKDAKTRLQEALQARGLALPRYRLETSSGPEHAREFTAACDIEALEITGTGRGPSRRRAEQAAAARALELLPQ